MKNKKNYTVYHCHTDQSLLDSATKYTDYVDKCVELGQTAICFTEHGNINNWVEKKMYCDKNNIKYIHGIECYLTSNHEDKKRDNYHTVLIAKNKEGFKELNNLVFLSTQESHRYYKPRLSFEEFLNISDNIIKISACIQSPLNIYDEKYSDLYSEKMLQHYDYYEIQYHNFEEQKSFNKYLVEMSARYNKPLIAGTDTHSINNYKAECRHVLQIAKNILYEDNCDLTYKTYDELVERFEKQNSVNKKVFLEAIENTNRMADSVESFDLDTKVKYPILYGEKDEEVLWNTLRKKYMDKVKNKIIEPNPKYAENIKEEMEVFKKVEMVGFMLFMSEMMTWCHEHDIPTSPCRGCFTKDAMIWTKESMKTLDKVQCGDYVLSADGKWNKVLNTFKYPICEPLVEFEYLKQGNSYNIYKNKCTTDHKVLVNKNNKIDYIQAKDLQVGDLLCSPKIKDTNNIYKDIIIDLNDYNVFGYKYDNEYIYEETNLSIKYKYSPRWCEKNIGVNRTFCNKLINGYIPNPDNQILKTIIDNTPFKTSCDYVKYCKKHSKNYRQIPRYIKLNYIWNVFLGLMYSDGNTAHNSGISLAVNRTTKDMFNRYVIYKIAKSLNLLNDVNLISDKDKNLDKITINSHILNQFFSKNFFKSKKGKEKTFNTKLFNQKNEYLKGLFNGLIKSDGSVNKKDNTIGFTSTSLSLISAYKILDNIVNQGMPNNLYVKEKHIDTRGYNNKESYQVRRSIINKKDYIQQDNNYWFLPITKIKNIEKCNTDVYDLEVENNHSYTINNIVVHNSVGGSTVAYISDITDVDPIIWNTVFSRFCNKDRKEVGDIDIDIFDDQRDLVFQYIVNRFGTRKTGRILSNGTLVEKSVIDTIGRYLSVQAHQNNKPEPYSLNELKEIKAQFSQNEQETREKYKDIFYYYNGLCDVVVSQSIHGAGIVASPIDLIDNYGMFMNKDKNGNEFQVMPINMEEIHEIGLIKYDILGLNTIGIVRKACEYSDIPYPKSHEINWNDEKVFKDMLTSPIGIFQFESSFAYSLLKKMQPTSIDEMSLTNASLRPSGESYRDKLMAKIPNKNPSKIIDKLLENNYGYLVFQEDTIKFLQNICGLSGSEADNVRRAIGRKQMDRLQNAMPSILEGYCKMSDQPREIAEQEAKQFLQIIEDSSNYQFG